MEKVEAILEKYDGSFRITPQRPPRGKRAPGMKKMKAELFHWNESDSMDIFVCPPKNPAAATTQVVKRFSWGGSISRSIYGTYRLNMPAQNPHGGEKYWLHELNNQLMEAYDWIENDKLTFQPLPQIAKKRKS